jgi:putative transposase
MISALLPNHAKSIYKEMSQSVEEQIFKFDLNKWVAKIYQDSLDTEFQEFIGFEKYQRDRSRKENYRNGFYTRSLDTVYGVIEEIRVPRDRNGAFQSKVIEKYKRREKGLDKLITECYWRGISTRDVKYVLKALAGITVSSSVVSNLTSKWNKEVFAWHQRQLKDDYEYLFLDGVWIKNRSLGLKKRLVLVAFGIKTDGTKEVIDYMLSTSEKEDNWSKFLQFLAHRGLKGKNLKLIATDGCHGLGNAVDLVFPDIAHQVCLAHKMRNILDKVKKADRPSVSKLLKPIFSKKVDTREKAESVINKWKKVWRPIYPAAVRSLESTEDKLLNYLDCPIEHHSMIRTTNHIERVFKELRRRMRPMEITPNLQAADRILYALIQIRNEKLANLKKLRKSKFTQ